MSHLVYFNFFWRFVSLRHLVEDSFTRLLVWVDFHGWLWLVLSSLLSLINIKVFSNKMTLCIQRRRCDDSECEHEHAISFVQCNGGDYLHYGLCLSSSLLEGIHRGEETYIKICDSSRILFHNFYVELYSGSSFLSSCSHSVKSYYRIKVF